ncbi:MAG TPA: hypothetical protein VI386_16355 [Candidatus Sulfotelmatobacter sp.]
MTAEPFVASLARWQNFYVIVGSSAGALSGLQFVVMTLIAEARISSSMREVRAFGSPTIVHFCVALLISAIASAPWNALSGPAVALEVCGIGGVTYSLRTMSHAKRQTGYQPDLEDWIWYGWAPLVTYGVLALAALLLARTTILGLFMVAGSSLALLFIGIHNSWDTVTYIAVQRPKAEKESPQQREGGRKKRPG